MLGQGHIWVPLCLVTRHRGVVAVAGYCPLLLLLLLHLPQAPEGEPREGGCPSERRAPIEAALTAALGREGQGLAELPSVTYRALSFLLQEKPKGVDNLALEP